MEQVSINYYGIDFVIWGYFSKGEAQTHDYPGSASEFDIKEIYLQNSNEDDNIIGLLSDDKLDEITDLIIEKLDEK